MNTNTINTNTLNTILIRLATGKEQTGSHANNMRGCKFWFKEIKDRKSGKIARPKLPDFFALLPTIQVSCQPAILSSVIQAHINSLQETIVKDAIEKLAPAIIAGTCTSFTLDAHQLTADALTTYLANNSSSARLDSDTIKSWADNNLRDMLTVAIADKQGWDAANLDASQDAKLAPVVSAYIAGLCKLAAPSPNLREQDATQLLAALELTDDGDTVASSLRNKLNAVLTKLRQPADILAAL